MEEMKRDYGFTLVELIIVIAIIGVVAAISTSSYLAARVNANEGGVKGALKGVQSACISYRTEQGAYPADLATMGSTYLGGGLELGDKSGYLYELRNGSAGESFTITAVPKSANFTGVRSYCTDAYNVIYSYNTATITGNGVSCPPGGTALS